MRLNIQGEHKVILINSSCLLLSSFCSSRSPRRNLLTCGGRKNAISMTRRLRQKRFAFLGGNKKSFASGFMSRVLNFRLVSCWQKLNPRAHFSIFIISGKIFLIRFHQDIKIN